MKQENRGYKEKGEIVYEVVKTQLIEKRKKLNALENFINQNVNRNVHVRKTIIDEIEIVKKEITNLEKNYMKC